MAKIAINPPTIVVRLGISRSKIFELRSATSGTIKINDEALLAPIIVEALK